MSGPERETSRKEEFLLCCIPVFAKRDCLFSKTRPCIIKAIQRRHVMHGQTKSLLFIYIWKKSHSKIRIDYIYTYTTGLQPSVFSFERKEKRTYAYKCKRKGGGQRRETCAVKLEKRAKGKPVKDHERAFPLSLTHVHAKNRNKKYIKYKEKRKSTGMRFGYDMDMSA